MGASLVFDAEAVQPVQPVHEDFDRLKPMADDLKVPENKVPGCLSVVHASDLRIRYS